MPTVPSIFMVFIAGIATIITPSAFLIIPTVVSGSVGSKFRPMAIVTGMSIAFTLMTIMVFAVVSFSFFVDYLRWLALFFIIGIGGTLLEDIYGKRRKLAIKFGLTGVTITIIAFLLIDVGGVGIAVGNAIFLSGIAIFIFSELNQIFVKISDSFRKKVIISVLDKMYPLALREGLFGGFFLGISLGILWIPSVGITLGSVFAYIARSTSAVTLFYGAILLIVYFLGFSIPLLIIIYLIKMISNNLGWGHPLKRSIFIKKLSGLILILVGLMMLLGIDKYLKVLLLPYFPIHV